MSLMDGAETILEECLDVKRDEEVALVDDGNDEEIIEVLKEAISERAELNYVRFPEPETSGEEPPDRVAEAMKQADVFLAPTKKSIYHKRARSEATKAGVRGATMPGVTKELMRTSVQADYQRVKEISSKALDIMEDADEIRIETPSGTDLTLDMKEEYARKLTGNFQEDGDFGNIPSGEVFGPGLNAEGTLVIDNLAPAPDAEGTVLEIEDNKVVEINSPQENDLEKKLGSIKGARNIAEFGLGTNPKAEIIGNMMNDEKVLGTVHIAFGDNEFFLPDGDERIVEADIHWDAICIDPTVYFGDELMIDEGEPVFLDD